MRIWHALNNLPASRRCPLKLLIFCVGTFLILYPKLWLLPRTVQRYADMNAVLDPDHPGLEPLAAEVRAGLADDADPATALWRVQQVVCGHVPYAYDWETWGVMEYLPTVDEVLRVGREDCDGRAVVAASLLRRLGYQAWLVSDLLHVWVQTPEGETMSPTGNTKLIVATERGSRLTNVARPAVLANLAKGLAFGVAAFPLLRELLILALLVVLSWRPGSHFWRNLCGCLLLWIALDLLRHTGRQAALQADWRHVLGASAAVGLALIGWLVLIVKAAGRRPRCGADSPR